MMRSFPITVAAIVALCGCMDLDTVSMRRIFDESPSLPDVPKLSPASVEVASRVDRVGRVITAGNPKAPIQPRFHTIGSPTPEIFHRTPADVFITEGLVVKCDTDAKLAAVLCSEVGKMESEREALVLARGAYDRPTPVDVPIGQDGYGFGGTGGDRTHLAELAKYDTDRQRRRAAPPPDPQVLARGYLQNAGYQAADLSAVAPLLEAAACNRALEKQLVPGR